MKKKSINKASAVVSKVKEKEAGKIEGEIPSQRITGSEDEFGERDCVGVR